MLLAQEPKLLLVDEPVAGMTDAETRQTAELLKEINRDKTVIVVEHDMTFVRELGVKVTCLHEGTAIAEGTIDQVSSNERVDRSLSWAMTMLEVQAIDLHYGAAQALRGVSLQGRARRGDLRARPQRRRQDQPARRAGRPAAGQRAARSLGRRTTSPS